MVSVVRQPVKVPTQGAVVGSSLTASSSGVSSATAKRILGALESHSNVSLLCLSVCLSVYFCLLFFLSHS